MNFIFCCIGYRCLARWKCAGKLKAGISQAFTAAQHAVYHLWTACYFAELTNQKPVFSDYQKRCGIIWYKAILTHILKYDNIRLDVSHQQWSCSLNVLQTPHPVWYTSQDQAYHHMMLALGVPSPPLYIHDMHWNKWIARPLQVVN